jgi:hypothetical protein
MLLKLDPSKSPNNKIGTTKKLCCWFKQEEEKHNVSLGVIDYRNYFKIAIVKWKKIHSCARFGHDTHIMGKH